jgi:predicted heme/steroid binding protein/uncharacterized Fe-S cluster protein YjdI
MIKEYKTENIIVYWDRTKCLHTYYCSVELPHVFKPWERPWVNINAASPEEIIRAIDKCPSGALSYALPEGSTVDPAMGAGPGSLAGKRSKRKSIAPRVADNGAGVMQQKVFTLDELQKYNGQNGNPAYVAVNGIVYNAAKSWSWRKGIHKKCSNSTHAGADLSELINSSPHGASMMNRLPIIGTLKKDSPDPQSTQ